ncbi:MAG: RNA methyltransferase [Anaerolineae bacterium CG_4_9_14_3_um_filter_57_17]|nr:RNA methyltransferase [bacterium]NCT20274.1 RNA methyltransferase [bacterium]OIO84754.1 MAG: hypothetical protein AUK01_08025 [Anaerolineae bacterium CG2_30_57_67]PJB64687.1 MAG: RNA methyltransferase [Anaerolineae bacterium CG_4_9_14_3_um_filter_57_17]
MPDPISSLSNPLIKQARALRQRKARDESGLFLVEGILHVGEAAQAGWPLEMVLYAPELLTSDFARALLARLQADGIRCQPVTPQAFESFAEKENPQGLAAIARQKRLALDAFLVRPIGFVVALVAPQDPGNVGTILRTLDATGGEALFLLENGVDVYHPSVVRASMGAIFWKPIIQASFDDFICWTNERGLRRVATSARGGLDYRALRADTRPTALVFGSEQKGLSAAHLAACPERVALPMLGRATSLNLAVAAGVLMYALAGAGVQNQKPE